MDSRFLALGDSYTIGESVSAQDRWPELLVAQLRASGVAVAPPEIVAVTGWTTDELDAGIDAAELRPPYDLVSLLIGVNNQYRARDIETYRTEFRTLLRRAIGFARGETGRLFVVSIPDWSVTPFVKRDERGRSPEQIGNEIDAFNAVARDEAEAVGVPFVDITPVSRAAADNPELTASDGLHPSGAMYRRWTEHILPVARRILS